MLRNIIILCLIFLAYQFFKAFRSAREQPETPASDPYHILGVSRQDSFESIRTKYLDLCKANHPDQVAHLSKAIQEAAHTQMQQINWAFAEIKKDLGVL